MAIPTQFSVTSTRTSPISNPALPQDPPQTADAENVSIVDGASVLPALSVGGINAPSEASALPSAAINTPNEYTAESVVILDTPTAASSESAAIIDAPTEATAEAAAVTDTPTAANVLPSADIDTPTARSAETSATIDTPSAASVLPAATIDNPFPSVPQQPAALDTPNEATAEPAATAVAPSTLTAKVGTLTTPPFPLNHPRFLVDNVLQNYETLTATNVASGFPAINALTPNTFETWRFSATSSTLSIDFGGAATRSFDTLCIGGHNLGAVNAIVEVWYEPEPGGTFFQFGDTKSLTLAENSPLCFFETSAVDALTIEVRITSVSGTAQISYISGGVALQMQRPLFNGHVPITDGDMTTYYNNKSESGNIIGRAIRAQGYKTEYSFQNIDDTWYRQYFAPFKQKVKLEPIFTAWNLLEYPDDIGYGMVEGDIQTSMQNGTVTKRSGLSFTLLGY